VYWRHVVASTIGETETQETRAVADSVSIEKERAGSDRYVENHMALIFQQGLSFSGFERNRVFLGRPGEAGAPSFLDLSDVSGGDLVEDCRATVIADFDDDGDPDIFTNAIQGETHLLLRNDIGAGHGRGFVKVRLRGTTGHASAVGAIVRAKRGTKLQAQVLSIGSGFESQNPGELIFGCGDETSLSLSVRWPGGPEETFGIVSANSRVLLIEGSGAPQPIEARTFRLADPPPRGVRFAVGTRPPGLPIAGPDGDEVTLPFTGGKPTLVTFWATSCAACREELPLLERLHKEGKTQVILVSLDPPERAHVIDRIRQRLSLTMPMPRIDREEASRWLEVDRLGIPLTLRFDGEGVLVEVIGGKLPDDYRPE
jgi:thiol-disulfide isomerase/thioredoxin